MSNYNAKADAFQQQVWDFGHNATDCFDAGNFEEAAKWVNAQDAAVVNMNYFIGLHRQELASA